ncbi:MAG TPA: aspartate/glutamate racemase family protein [Thermoanaerobaculia bacterium]|nr:aspartate/glutamate racemase family protein [Thermoanaerobaculia bacterium]
MKHIGIVACTAEGASLCYRTICHSGDHPQVSIHTHSLAEYMRCIDRDDWGGVGALMLSSADKLKAAGAEFLICPDNTIHYALHFVGMPLPFLHIAEVVLAASSYRRLGLLGTRYLVESDVYPADCVRPDAEERIEVNRIIFEELVYGDFRPSSIGYLQSVIERLKAQGCDAVILGCTELPLVLNDGNSPLPVLDSTRLLARAALEYAT